MNRPSAHQNPSSPRMYHWAELRPTGHLHFHFRFHWHHAILPSSLLHGPESSFLPGEELPLVTTMAPHQWDHTPPLARVHPQVPPDQRSLSKRGFAPSRDLHRTRGIVGLPRDYRRGRERHGRREEPSASSEGCRQRRPLFLGWMPWPAPSLGARLFCATTAEGHQIVTLCGGTPQPRPRCSRRPRRPWPRTGHTSYLAM